MKLATLSGAGPDGRLVVVSRDLSRALDASDIAPTLQFAIDHWEAVEPRLRERYDAVQKNDSPGTYSFKPADALAPLPRAWQWLDGSVFKSHGELMSLVFNIEVPDTGLFIMYQGLSDTFYAPDADIPFRSEADGIDFEGEFAVIVDRVPMGVTPERALGHIRLIAQINDWSLRALLPAELFQRFGPIQGKPPCSMAPVVVTPDELGDAWANGRVALPLEIHWNGEAFGRPNGGEMECSFGDLIAQAAGTRNLCAGTIVGSGTVSNPNFREVGSACIAERRGIEMLDHGTIQTDFMRFGDRVSMEAHLSDGTSVFGKIDQRVIRAAG